MNTKTANAKKTNPTRFRMSGTSSAFRRVLSMEGAAGLPLARLAQRGAGRGQRFLGAGGEEHVAEAQPLRQRRAGLVAAEHFHAVTEIFELAALLQRLRRDFHGRIPVGERADVDHREL